VRYGRTKFADKSRRLEGIVSYGITRCDEKMGLNWMECNGLSCCSLCSGECLSLMLRKLM